MKIGNSGHTLIGIFILIIAVILFPVSSIAADPVPAAGAGTGTGAGTGAGAGAAGVGAAAGLSTVALVGLGVAAVAVVGLAVSAVASGGDGGGNAPQTTTSHH